MVATVTITLVILGGAVLFLDLRDHKKVSMSHLNQERGRKVDSVLAC